LLRAEIDLKQIDQQSSGGSNQSEICVVNPGSYESFDDSENNIKVMGSLSFGVNT
jgi:hypothetical protein